MLNPPHLSIVEKSCFSSLLFHLSSSLSFNTAIVKTYLLVRSLLPTLVNFPLADMYSFARLLALAVLLGVPLAFAHGMIAAASGDAGGNRIGLGVSSSTSNDQQEVTQFNGNGRIPPLPRRYQSLKVVIPEIRQHRRSSQTIPSSTLGRR